MQYDAETPDAYLALLEDDWRKDRLLAIRDIFLREVEGLSEGIGYGMLRYERNGDVFGHLNAQKAYVGVYLGDLERIDPGGAIRAGMNCGKSCLRVRKRDGLGVVRRLVARKASRG
ncbi:MAG: DUF1801 domain-containing protein [Paracoccaceae bacterium]|nr:DUF1801 domain-containing protein [Paracoccaceae bacterium]